MRTKTSPQLLFRGRPGDVRLSDWIMLIDDLPAKLARETAVLWGCPDDEGVILNRGRAGAKEGPDSIRSHLFRMTPPMDFEWEQQLDLYDYGNLAPVKDIVETHARCRHSVKSIGTSGATLIAMGGGHDFAAPNLLGFLEGLGDKATRAGLINVDPHLDVRELENNIPNSGTPFRIILDSKKIGGQDFIEFGARANRNARSHYNYCRDRGVAVHTLEALRESGEKMETRFEWALRELNQNCSTLAVTFDMDSCYEAEGVSAAPVLGFSAWELCRMAEIAGNNLNVRYFEIAEVAPALDGFQRSGRIGAEMIFFFLRARALALGADL